MLAGPRSLRLEPWSQGSELLVEGKGVWVEGRARGGLGGMEWCGWPPGLWGRCFGSASRAVGEKTRGRKEESVRQGEGE